MKKVFKSSIFISYIKATMSFMVYIFFCLVFILYIIPHTRELMYRLGELAAILILGIAVIITAMVSPFFAYAWYRIKIEVDKDDVVFYKKGKIYQIFRIADHTFTPYVRREKRRGVFSSTMRYLRVVNLKSEDSIDCLCLNFSRRTFDRCMTHINTCTVREEVPDAQGFTTVNGVKLEE